MTDSVLGTEEQWQIRKSLFFQVDYSLIGHKKENF